MPPRLRSLDDERLGLSYDPDVFESAKRLYHAELVATPNREAAPPTKLEGPPFPRRFLQLAEAEQRRKEAAQQRTGEAQQTWQRRKEEELEAEQRKNDLRRYEAEAARFVEGFVQELEEVHIVPTMRRSTTSAKQIYVEILLDLQRDRYRADGPAISIGPSPVCSPWLSRADRQLNSMIVQRLRKLGYEVQWLRALDFPMGISARITPVGASCVDIGACCFPLARLLSMINSVAPSGGCISEIYESMQHRNRGSTWNSGDVAGLSDLDGAWGIRIFL